MESGHKREKSSARRNALYHTGMRLIDDTDMLAKGVPPHVYSRLSPFLKKLFCILNGVQGKDGPAGDPAPSEIIEWNSEGTSFHIRSIPRLEKDVLPKWFKTNSYPSFARQLNIYNFSKETHLQSGTLNSSQSAEPARWKGEFFLRDHPELSLRIKRKDGASKGKHPRTSTAETTDALAAVSLPLQNVEKYPINDEIDLSLTTQLPTSLPSHPVIIDPKPLITTILSIQNKQSELIRELADLKQQNSVLVQQVAATDQRSRTQEDFLKKLFHGLSKAGFQWGTTVPRSGSPSNSQDHPSRLREHGRLEDVLERLIGARKRQLMIEGPPEESASKEPSHIDALEDVPSPTSTVSDGHRFTTLDTPGTDAHSIELDTLNQPTDQVKPKETSPSAVALRKNSNNPFTTLSTADLAAILSLVQPENFNTWPNSAPPISVPENSTPVQPEAPWSNPLLNSSLASPSTASLAQNSAPLATSNSADPGANVSGWDFSSMAPIEGSLAEGSYAPSFPSNSSASGSNLTLQHILSDPVLGGYGFENMVSLDNQSRQDTSYPNWSDQIFQQWPNPVEPSPSSHPSGFSNGTVKPSHDNAFRHFPNMGLTASGTGVEGQPLSPTEEDLSSLITLPLSPIPPSQRPNEGPVLEVNDEVANDHAANPVSPQIGSPGRKRKSDSRAASPHNADSQNDMVDGVRTRGRSKRRKAA